MRRSTAYRSRLASFLLLGAACLLWSRCDTVEPGSAPLLVVEGYFDAAHPLPPLVLRQTRPLNVPYPDDVTTAVTDAEVMLYLNGRPVSYRHVPGGAGRYAPAPGAERMVPPGAHFDLSVVWQDRRATAAGGVPLPIALDSLALDVPPRPVKAVLLDTLFFTDTLGVTVQKGYLYPVEVTLWWRAAPEAAAADSAFWVQARLRPSAPPLPTALRFFFRPEQILRERDLPRDAAGRRSWTGVYAVPVAGADDPLPPHQLRVSVLRSGRDYARFASSRSAPDRREPRTNVQGALGIVAGISVDSMTVHVGHGRTSKVD